MTEIEFNKPILLVSILDEQCHLIAIPSIPHALFDGFPRPNNGIWMHIRPEDGDQIIPMPDYYATDEGAAERKQYVRDVADHLGGYTVGEQVFYASPHTLLGI